MLSRPTKRKIPIHREDTSPQNQKNYQVQSSSMQAQIMHRKATFAFLPLEINCFPQYGSGNFTGLLFSVNPINIQSYVAMKYQQIRYIECLPCIHLLLLEQIQYLYLFPCKATDNVGNTNTTEKHGYSCTGSTKQFIYGYLITSNISIDIPFNGSGQINIHMQSIIIAMKMTSPESSHKNYQVDSA